jgi:predicted nucleic acid-binding protein
MILVDADVLLALVDRGRPGHRTCVETLRTLREPLATIWPVLGVALAATDGLPAAQAAMLEMVARGAVQLLPLGPDDASQTATLLSQRRKPMSFAHAALVHVAQRDGLGSIFTLSGAELSAQRSAGRSLRILPGSRSRREARASSGSRRRRP